MLAGTMVTSINAPGRAGLATHPHQPERPRDSPHKPGGRLRATRAALCKRGLHYLLQPGTDLVGLLLAWRLHHDPDQRLGA
jgi:hypothetical protein